MSLLMSYTVYILKCSDESLYVGSTNDLERRVKEHNSSKNGAHYTKIRRPVILVHAELYSSFRKARAREAAIKRLNRDNKLKLFT